MEQRDFLSEIVKAFEEKFPETNEFNFEETRAHGAHTMEAEELGDNCRICQDAKECPACQDQVFQPDYDSMTIYAG